MSSEVDPPENFPFDKLRGPTREVTFWCGGEPVKDEIRISTLCQYCPNDECPGTYSASSDVACKTLKKWKQDRVSLEDAVRAKYRHEERHETTDEFREWVVTMLSETLTLDSENEEKANYELASYAACIAKGQTAFGARNNCGPDDKKYRIGEAVLDPVTDSICEIIEQKRDEVFGSDTSGSRPQPPVSEGEQYTVDIISTGKKGDGIAKLDGYVLVVPNASVGDTVTVEIDTATPNVAFTQPLPTNPAD